MWSTFVHRWRRPILHVIAGGAIVCSGAVGMTRGPSGVAVGDTSPSQVEALQVRLAAGWQRQFATAITVSRLPVGGESVESGGENE